MSWLLGSCECVFGQFVHFNLCNWCPNWYSWYQVFLIPVFHSSGGWADSPLRSTCWNISSQTNLVGFFPHVSPIFQVVLSKVCFQFHFFFASPHSRVSWRWPQFLYVLALLFQGLTGNLPSYLFFFAQETWFLHENEAAGVWRRKGSQTRWCHAWVGNQGPK